MLAKGRANRISSLAEVIFILEQVASGKTAISLPKHTSPISSNQYAGLITAVLILAVTIYIIQSAKSLPTLLNPENDSLAYFRLSSPMIYETTEFVRGYKNKAEGWIRSEYIEKFEKVSPNEWIWSRKTEAGEIPKLHLIVDHNKNIHASLISGNLVGEVSCGKRPCGPAFVDDYLFLPYLPGDLPSRELLPFATWQSHESELSVIKFADDSQPLLEPVISPQLIEARKFDNVNTEMVSFFRWPYRSSDQALVFPFGWDDSYPGRPRLRFLQWPHQITNDRVPKIDLKLNMLSPKTTLVLRIYSDCRSLLPLYNDNNWKRCRLFQDIVFGRSPSGTAMGPLLTVEGTIDYFPHDRDLKPELEQFLTIDKVTLAHNKSPEKFTNHSSKKQALPELFLYHDTPPQNQYCILLTEPQDESWQPTSLCTQEDLGLRWSHEGPLNDMICVRINEGEPDSPWQDNFLCHPHRAKFNLHWSNFERPEEGLCYSVTNGTKEEWRNNYLCVVG